MITRQTMIACLVLTVLLAGEATGWRRCRRSPRRRVSRSRSGPWSAFTGGTILSRGNNTLEGNGTDGTFDGAVTSK